MIHTICINRISNEIATILNEIQKKKNVCFSCLFIKALDMERYMLVYINYCVITLYIGTIYL